MSPTTNGLRMTILARLREMPQCRSRDGQSHAHRDINTHECCAAKKQDAENQPQFQRSMDTAVNLIVDLLQNVHFTMPSLHLGGLYPKSAVTSPLFQSQPPEASDLWPNCGRMIVSHRLIGSSPPSEFIPPLRSSGSSI